MEGESDTTFILRVQLQELNLPTVLMDNKLRIKLPLLFIERNFVQSVNGMYLSGALEYRDVGFRDCKLVDVEGICYETDGTVSTGNVSLWDSIINFQVSYIMSPILQREPYQIAVDDLKKMIIDIVRHHPRKFNSIGPASMIVECIEEMATYKEIIKFF